MSNPSQQSGDPSLQDILLGLLLAERRSKKPDGLRQLQREWLARFHGRLLELGWRPEQLLLDLPTGTILQRTDGVGQFMFAQYAIDKVAREKFAFWRDQLPASLRVRSLPLSHVGALPTIDLHAFAGFAAREQDDFLLLPGIPTKLGAWAFAVSRAMGTDLTGDSPSALVDEGDRWKNSLLPLAYDIHGCSFDPTLAARIVLTEMPDESKVTTLSVIIHALEGFVLLHEIGHFELGHGQYYRSDDGPREPSNDERRRMESEADAFAIEHLRGVGGAGVIASTCCMLFLLLAITPDYVDSYPFCFDDDSHPHPLRRLGWILQSVFPNNPGRQMGYLKLMIPLLRHAVAREESDPEFWERALCGVALGAGPAPHLRPADQ